jgi:nitrogen regulatory protein P-II 1
MIELVSGKKIRTDILPRTKIGIVVEDKAVRGVTDLIVKTACTDTIGGGKIFSFTIDEAIRIRTNERGEDHI